MAEYYNVTTNLGDAEIANAIATNTKLNITHIAFGDGNGSVPTPNKARTSLVREVHRQAVTKYERHATNANWIVIETIIPSSIGGFWVREMGIIANGKLISHGSHAPFEKVADPSGVSEYRLRFTQNVTDGSVVEITLDESLIYASQAWVEENFIKRTEIVDNLITADPNKPLSANAGKSLQDGKLDKNDNAVSATKLHNARTIGGVPFNGIANINLPGVNVAGNQSTSGNAATATELQTARTIAISGAVTGTATAFDGSANIAIATTAIDGSKISTGTIPAARIPAASTSVAGVVKLNNTLTSNSTNEAATAAQVKILNDTKSTVVVMTGIIADGGTIPLPDGFTESQCKWMVSLANGTSSSHAADNRGSDQLNYECSLNGRVVTAKLRMSNTVHGGVATSFTANYMIIGVK
ncbi:hypothetical protein A6M14_09665 [Acinetobacter sp. Ac_877]|uniref:phage tail-collar fiber domain-containing protein n=1 Tax=Acinetobacter portensis TaxID=1839785 RepID=UPI00128DF03B|nr:phage tail protein [Acinetobacter portensis]MPW41735.1 hypothetical protein [Acinetobacter portensis]